MLWKEIHMKITRVVAAIVLATPLVAAAQVSYYRESPRVCHDRNASLWERKAMLDADQRVVDREGANLDRIKARLDEDYRASTGRTDRDRGVQRALRRVQPPDHEHNRIVARMNGAAAC
jgi:hypothetical protein